MLISFWRFTCSLPNIFELRTNRLTKSIQCRSMLQDGSLSFFPSCPLSKGFTHVLRYTGIKSLYWTAHILFNIKIGLIFQKAPPLFWLLSLSNTLFARIYSISCPVSFTPSFFRTLPFAPLYGVAWLRKVPVLLVDILVQNRALFLTNRLRRRSYYEASAAACDLLLQPQASS